MINIYGMCCTQADAAADLLDDCTLEAKPAVPLKAEAKAMAQTDTATLPAS